jgi:hypothetical protein
MKMDNLKIFKDKLEEVEIGITTQTYISSDDGDYLISLAKELIRTVEEQQEDIGLLAKNISAHLDEKKERQKEIENLKQYKKVLMEASIGITDYIKKLEEENKDLVNECKKVSSQWKEGLKKVERYEKALKFYADKENYEEWKDVNPEVNYIHNVDFDGGDKARKALENSQTEK